MAGLCEGGNGPTGSLKAIIAYAVTQLGVNSQFQNLIFATGGNKNKLFKKQMHEGKHFVGQKVENSLILKTGY
ncbi:hypothetical protein ANN_13935 [Periplaneta americana]|uniref:Uncharacterized protein n=1 Tax=Periplaneta americana TaxID=6978 RepID=A0ABQ8SUX0_PERAM|nr:hypothetical protein ANN_13935 [Periplaneta americana]